MVQGSVVLEYALRIACLQALLDYRSHLPKEPERLGPTPSSTPSKINKDDRSSFFAFDLGSLMGGGSSKSPKYPEKLLKILEGKLQRIAMNQEPKYSDHRFRRVAAAYYSTTLADKNYQRQQKESRKIEDLILAFVTTATKSLKKEEELADGGWKYELNAQISIFLELLADCLSYVGPVPQELSTRLDSYRTRLKQDPPQDKSDRGHGDGESVMSFKSTRKEEGLKGHFTDVVAQLFRLDEETFSAKLKELGGKCTEQAALEDLKTFLKRLNTDSPVPYGPQDFTEPSQWTAYRAGEVSTLSQMMLLMMQSNPSLSQSSDRASNGDLASRVDGLKLDAPPSEFTYVPSDPSDVYRDLLSRCLDWDLEVLKDLPEDEDVSLGILSQDHVGLLTECALRWRLPSSFRAMAFLEAIVDRFENGLVPAACVHEAVAMVDKVKRENPMSNWPIAEAFGLDHAVIRRDISFLSAVHSPLSFGQGYHSPDFHEAVTDYLTLEIDDHSHPEVHRLSHSICEKIRVEAYESYISEASDRLEHEGSKTKSFAMGMGSWIESQAKKLNRKFGDAINPHVDVVPLVLQQQLTLWFRDLEDAMVPIPGRGVDEDMEESFALYKKAKKLLDLGNAFSKEPIHFSLAPAFEPIVRQWLDQTGTKTRQWADQALAVDHFEPTSENGPSSSVTDLFDSFRSASDFLMGLDWPDEEQLAYFATRLAKIFALSINDYCNKMEQLFAQDMMQEDVVQPVQTAAKQKAWIEKAKSTLASLQGEKKIQAFFNFTPASCVKLNNIEAARQQLDKLYQEMRVDDLAAYDTAEPLPKPEDQKFLFTVKIVLAEGLGMDSSSKLPDSFVILSDEHGNRHAKTRTIYDDTDPRWDETFDIGVKGSAWFMATVRHRVLTGKHDLIGRSYLRLDPSQHADLISKDVLLPLDSRGHLLFRISMEGERDDIQFHFGRAFRWLKRTESDMVRTLVDKMTPVLRSTLSRASIKSVLKPGGNNPLPLDYNEALGKLSAAYRSAIGNPEYTIPLPADQKKRGPTDAEIESAIHPLFDYLDANNHTLSSTLSRDAMQMVMAKLWKQILMTIESLIVPPLSDKPSHMRSLTDGELDIALKWLKFLRDFFYAGGDENGVPLNVLQNQKFNEILSVRIYYDWKTDDLMEECIRGFQSTLKNRAAKPSKSLLSQRNLGTIRARKSAKKALGTTGNNTEMIMRILRMRQGTQEFLAQQLQTISVVKMENPKTGRSIRNTRR